MASRSPKGEGKAPRVSVSLPDELKAVIEKEAAGRGITVSKYISDVLTHCHDKDGVNIPAPSNSADLTPLVNMMQQMMSEIQDIKRGMTALPPAPVDSASQSSTKEMHYAAPQTEGYEADLVTRFKAWMKEHKYNDKTFKAAYGFDVSHLKQWGNGERKFPHGKAQDLEDVMTGRKKPEPEDW
jgi:hypothetical protein